MRPMNRAKRPRQQRSAVRSTSGASRRSRLCGRLRRAETILQASKDHLPKAANLSRIGARSCVTLWPPLHPLIIAGRRPIGGTSHRACTCPRSNAGDWARSWSPSIPRARSESVSWNSLQVRSRRFPRRHSRKPSMWFTATQRFSAFNSSNLQSRCNSNPREVAEQTSARRSSGSLRMISRRSALSISPTCAAIRFRIPRNIPCYG